jgi:hypothetical protein
MKIETNRNLQARRRSVSFPVNVAIALLVTDRGGLIIVSSSSNAHGIGESRLPFELSELTAGSLLPELAVVVAFVVDEGGGELAFDAVVVLVVITVSGDGAETGTVFVDGPILPGIIWV